MHGMRVKYAYHSDKGGRENNQDRWGFIEIDRKQSVFIVCDGLGGHQAGELAAAVAISEVEKMVNEHFEFSAEWITGALTQANDRVLEEARKSTRFSDMKTTAVILAVSGERALWGHVGDSRLYHFNHGDLVSKTKDHSVIQMLLEYGEIEPEEADTHPDRNKLLRVLGESNNEFKVSISKVREISDSDTFILCTDGFWEKVSVEEMSEVLKENTLEYQADTLHQLVSSRIDGESDNCTFVLVKKSVTNG